MQPLPTAPGQAAGPSPRCTSAAHSGAGSCGLGEASPEAEPCKPPLQQSWVQGDGCHRGGCCGGSGWPLRVPRWLGSSTARDALPGMAGASGAAPLCTEHLHARVPQSELPGGSGAAAPQRWLGPSPHGRSISSMLRDRHFQGLFWGPCVQPREPALSAPVKPWHHPALLGNTSPHFPAAVRSLQ